MAKHEVGLQIDQLTFLGKVDIRIPVRSDGEYLGSLHISKGSLDWVAGRSTKYARYRISWEKFAEMMEARNPNQSPQEDDERPASGGKEAAPFRRLPNSFSAPLDSGSSR
jgi:hypothetical protein